MFHRSLRVAIGTSKQGRTIVRDPRKKKAMKYPVANASQNSQNSQDLLPKPLLFPIAPLESNQHGTQGLGSYMIAGAGMAIGFSIVGAIFGGF